MCHYQGQSTLKKKGCHTSKGSNSRTCWHRLLELPSPGGFGLTSWPLALLSLAESSTKLANQGHRIVPVPSKIYHSLSSGIPD